MRGLDRDDGGLDNEVDEGKGAVDKEDGGEDEVDVDAKERRLRSAVRANEVMGGRME